MMVDMDIQEIRRSCENCKNKFICIVKENFEKPLLDSRICIERGRYSELCMDFFKILSSKCKRYDAYEEEEDE